jgi:hypothetical protein
MSKILAKDALVGKTYATISGLYNVKILSKNVSQNDPTTVLSVTIEDVKDSSSVLKIPAGTELMELDDQLTESKTNIQGETLETNQDQFQPSQDETPQTQGEPVTQQEPKVAKLTKFDVIKNAMAQPDGCTFPELVKVVKESGISKVQSDSVLSADIKAYLKSSQNSGKLKFSLSENGVYSLINE